jgi:uncharacterized RDD family membrane protein YckC
MPAHLIVTQPGAPGPTRVLEARAAGTPDSDPEASFFAEREALPAEVQGATGDVVAAPAGLFRRVGAWLFDVAVIGALVGAFFGAALAVVGTPSPAMLGTVVVPALGLLGFVAFVYTTLFAFLFRGRTPGRRVLGIALVDSSGQAPKAGRALVRAALSLMSFALCLSGFWLALFDRRGQTLHDKLTSTFVVRLKLAA